MQFSETNVSVIHDFNTLPQASLEILAQNIGLRMSRAELSFCAKNYKSRDGKDISVNTLRMLDALACPAHVKLTKIAIAEMLTDCEKTAETFRDAISKLHALGESAEKPITLQDIADLPARYLQMLSGKKTMNLLATQGTASVYAERGYFACNRLESPYGIFDHLLPLPFSPREQAEYADVLVLLSPDPQMPHSEFDELATVLLHDDDLSFVIHCVADLSYASIAHAVIGNSRGAAINIARLPEHLQSTEALAKPTSGMVLALSQKELSLLQQKAKEMGLSAHYFGIVDHAGYLIAQNGPDPLFALDINYLKSLCFIRSYSLRLHESELHNQVTGIYYTMDLRGAFRYMHEQTSYASKMICPPEQRATRILTGQAPLAHALLCAADAYCLAVARGYDPTMIHLHAHLRAVSQKPLSHSYGNALSVLLGLYRFSMEAMAHVSTEVTFGAKETDLIVLADSLKNDSFSSTLQGGRRIYLLHPLYDACGLPDLHDLSKLAVYLHRMIKSGKICAARALCGKTPTEVLDEMANGTDGFIKNHYFAHGMDLSYPAGFVVEAETELEGELIAYSALPTDLKTPPQEKLSP
ncbi:MAG: hypothetical protein IJW70_06495 [Clostridia bacterium]|nr:hypothetical protein [Clostridia bacterium]